MKVFAYIRYSSLNQKDNTSVETQRDAIAAFVRQTPELAGRVIVERRDEAKSGTTLEGREALLSILGDRERGIIGEAQHGDAVAVFKFDRLGRDLRDAVNTIHALQQRGIKVYSATESNDEFSRNIMLTIAQQFSRQLSDRCKRGLDNRARGGFAANKAPFGYEIKRNGGGPGKFVPVPAAAAVIREIFTRRAGGDPLRQIVAALNAAAAPSPRQGQWTIGTVHTILQNEAYIGTVISGAREFKKGHGFVKVRPRAEWIVTENAHEPIVTRELWHAVRGLEETPTPKRSTPRKRSEYLWTGFLRCRHCGGNFTRTPCDGVGYLGCPGGRDFGTRYPCRCRYLLREDVVTEEVFKQIWAQVYTPDFVATLGAYAKEELAKLTGDAGGRVSELQARLQRVSGQIDTATRRLVYVTQENEKTFLEELNKLQRDRDSIKAEITQTKSLAGLAVSPGEVDQAIERRLFKLRHATVSDVGEARAELALHVDHIAVANDRRAWLYAKPNGLLAGLQLKGWKDLPGAGEDVTRRLLVSPQGFEPWSSG